MESFADGFGLGLRPGIESYSRETECGKDGDKKCLYWKTRGLIIWSSTMRRSKKGSEQEKALAASEKCDDTFRETLTEKQKEQLALCSERKNELLTVFEKEVFVRGFKLGARMTAVVLSGD